MKQVVFVVIFAIILDVTSVETGNKMLQKKFLLDGHDNTCDFNANTLCSWRNVRDFKAGEVSDDFDWTLYAGSTPTDDTGPSVDHTTETDKGTYAFIESSAPRVLGERAWMESPEIRALGQSVVCFRFWYHKFGEKMGNLSVYQHQHGPRPGSLVWSDVTDHGDRWLSAQVPLLANMDFRIILEGVIGDGFLGDIAVDDVSVGNEYCLVAPPEASRSNVTPPPVTSVPSPVDGAWGDWTTWSACSVSCGGGNQSRSRSCYFRDGVPHGADCMGDSRENRTCNTVLCPVDGVWTSWSAWSVCTVTCGGGTWSRDRTCIYPNGLPHGHNCTGQATERRTCNTNICPVDGVWTFWSAWSVCTVTCGGGTGSRDRTCIYTNGFPHGHNCTGQATERHTCNTNICPVDGVWTSWSAWSVCTVTCGGGTGTRDRTCQYPSGTPHGHNCTGQVTESKTCSMNICPVDGRWDAWSSWSTCTVSCGGGSHARQRTCLFDPVAPHGNTCFGDGSQNDTCNTNLCPVDGVWSDWSAWAKCSVTCGNGYKSRDRNCQFNAQNAPHGRDCSGNKTETESCKMPICPVDGFWSPWSPWFACTITCGGGSGTRDRTCQYPPGVPHGHNCTGQATETHTCNTDVCPVDGVWTSWSSWSACAVTCGGGTGTRDRTCQYPPGTPHGHNCTGQATEWRVCNADRCPMDYVWSNWFPWVVCSVTCGGGNQSRTRLCIFTGSPPGAYCTGDGTEHRTCNTESCPVDGVWTSWSSWSACTVTCGGGTGTRDRTCMYPAGFPHGHNCTGQATESKTCSMYLCPVDGRWDAWSSWSTCTVSCGGGSHARQRTCLFDPVAPHGNKCFGDGSQNDTCNTNLCPVDGVWSDWSAWAKCSVTCGNGYKSRDRNCQFNAQNAPHGRDCSGNKTETESCKMPICPDSNQCYFCDDNSTQGFVTNATSCITDTACKTNEVCFAENYYRPGDDMGYRFRCKDLMICRYIMQNIFQYLEACFGHIGDPLHPECSHESQGTCSVCCGGGGCNNDTCRNIKDRLYLDYRAGRLNMTSLRVVQP